MEELLELLFEQAQGLVLVLVPQLA